MLVVNSKSGGNLYEVIVEQLEESLRVDICVSFIRSSGLSFLIEKIRGAVDRGCNVRILTSTYLYVTQPCALRTLLNEMNRNPGCVCVKIYPAGDYSRKKFARSFHTKAYIFRSENPLALQKTTTSEQKKRPQSVDTEVKEDSLHGKVIVGSANISKSGLKSGVEWSILEKDAGVLQRTLREFESLWYDEDLFVLDERFLQRYENDFVDFNDKKLRKEQRKAQMENEKGITSNDRTKVTQSALQSTLEDFKVETCNALIDPNAFQRAALNQLEKFHNMDKRAAAVIAATGLGKTYLAAFDIQQFLPEQGKVLVVAHRTDLIRQTASKFQHVIPEVAESASLLVGGLEPEPAQFVFATVQSLTSENNKMLAWERNYFDYIVVDEFHHAVAATYQRVLDYFNPTFVLGLTATPERPDGKDVIEVCNNNVAYRMDLTDAINEGYLVPFHYLGVAEDSAVSYDDFSWSNLKDVSLVEKEVLKRRVEYIVEKLEEYGFDGIKRKCLGYCVSIKHAEFMAQKFNERLGEGVAVSITSKNPDSEYREDVFRKLEDLQDPLKFVFSVNVLNEGIDIPSVNTVLFLRPTASSIVFMQQLGRGLRLHSEREYLTVLDFVGNKRALEFSLRAIHDPSRGKFNAALGKVKPPEGCEVLLEEQTQQVLDSIRMNLTNKEEKLREIKQIALELGDYPTVMDLLSFNESPDLSDIRKYCGSFLEALYELEKLRLFDGEASNPPVRLPKKFAEFVQVFEKNWQEKRIETYAYIYGLLKGCKSDLAFDVFYDAFPEWRVEEKSADRIKLYGRLERKMVGKNTQGEKVHYFDKNKRDFSDAAKKLLEDSEYGHIVKEEVLKRLYYINKRDYWERHMGELKTPSELLYEHLYSRRDIVNHFARQYDPQKYERGVVFFKKGKKKTSRKKREQVTKIAPETERNFGDQDVVELRKDHFALFVKYKKASRAKKRGHDYADEFLGPSRFQWQTPNRWTQSTAKTKKLVKHRQRDIEIHLFVQTKSGEPYAYFGQLDYKSHHGEKPVTFVFDLHQSVSRDLREVFGLDLAVS